MFLFEEGYTSLIQTTARFNAIWKAPATHVDTSHDNRFGVTWRSPGCSAGCVVMNETRRSMIVRVTGLAVALALAVGGCGKSDHSASSITATSASATSPGATSSGDTVKISASSSAATVDYASLLAKPSDFPAGDAGPWTVTPPRAIPPDPPGVSQTYTSGPEQAVDTSILMTDDATGAEVFIQGSAEGVKSQVIGGTQVPLPAVSPDAMFTSGTSTNGKSAEAALLFTVENTAVIMIFAGPLGHPIPQGFAEAVAKAQTSAIRAGLPRLR
jgi:hypothetical protein